MYMHMCWGSPRASAAARRQRRHRRRAREELEMRIRAAARPRSGCDARVRSGRCPLSGSAPRERAHVCCVSRISRTNRNRSVLNTQTGSGAARRRRPPLRRAAAAVPVPVPRVSRTHTHPTPLPACARALHRSPVHATAIMRDQPAVAWGHTREQPWPKCCKGRCARTALFSLILIPSRLCLPRAPWRFAFRATRRVDFATGLQPAALAASCKLCGRRRFRRIDDNFSADASTVRSPASAMKSLIAANGGATAQHRLRHWRRTLGLRAGATSRGRKG